MPKRKFTIYKMEFESPLHAGSAGIGEESVQHTIRSDTLFGALCWAHRELYGKKNLEELLKKFKSARKTHDLPFFISSTFPFMKEYFFLPNPLSSGLKEEFLEKSLFELVIKGETPEKEEIGKINEEKRFATLKGFAAERTILEEILEGNEIPFRYIGVQKNVQNRISKETDTYIVGGTVFKEGCGLYFIEEGKDLFPELKYLGETGIGGNRSLGMGRFNVKREEIEIDTPDEEDYQVLLSLCLPKKGETEKILQISLAEGESRSRYILEKRVGWVDGTSIRQKGFRMLKEGSVVEKKGEELIGDFLKASDGKEAYRYGYGMTIPIKA